MKIHEYQAKDIFRKYGLPVPEGKVAHSAHEAKQAAEELGTSVVVVKAQVHAGGRGKAGGVKLAKSPEEAAEIAANMIGNRLKTYQNPEGLPINVVLIEAGVNIDKEYYVGITLDREVSRPVLMVSAAGGMEIEEIAKTNPELIIKEHIDPVTGLMPYQARKITFKIGLTDKKVLSQFVRLAMTLARMYFELDASLIEVNPLVLTKEGNLICLDAKIEFDENALFRHCDILELEDTTQIDPLELEAKKWDLNYVKLDGNIGCMVNGAGLAMATMDTIKFYGGEPANFLDVGGGATVERVAAAFKLLLSDPNVKAIFVNIFGGIVRCDRIAGGIVEAAKQVNLDRPLIVRLEGTNVELGRKMLEESGLNIIPAKDMADGAEKAVKAAKGEL
ncbi:ADP-forming succinate--CoA ligase subunit beta [Desulfurobacterium atlanticum]|uniref:Succinate--CoA ligase [ADP-forming] subunit beta n=1 Tax=Desulfurobacterium atlanticum TaxID=240169 RepID=A0A238XKV0_9BACT|nr:ADP-forming succinate--CoA ligase subunit beta [Desulfurobacterium atlanticum]SNR59201.1 succinyl-CoA synthetase beta subunit [Desulfurobacterium atlanticum]